MTQEQTMRGILEKLQGQTLSISDKCSVKELNKFLLGDRQQAEASLKSLIGREVIGEDEVIVDTMEQPYKSWLEGKNDAKAEARKKLEEL